MEQSQKQHQVWCLLPEKSTAVTHSGHKWKSWYDGTCRVWLLTSQTWICWVPMAEVPLSSEGHRGAPVCVRWSPGSTMQTHRSGLSLAFLPGQKKREALASPQMTNLLLKNCCWHHSFFSTPCFSPLCYGSAAPFAFVLFSHITKTRRAAVMDRTSSTLAGFWWKAIWFPQPSYLMSL